MDRFDVRAQIEKDLQEAGLMEKVEAYTNKVGFSERTNVAIEPKLSMQWFLKMQHFADMALPPVMNDELKFYPAKYKNTYKNWLEKHQGLVYQPPVVVGTPHPGLLPASRRLCGSRNDRRSRETGSGKKPATPT